MLIGFFFRCYVYLSQNIVVGIANGPPSGSGLPRSLEVPGWSEEPEPLVMADVLRQRSSAEVVLLGVNKVFGPMMLSSSLLVACRSCVCCSGRALLRVLCVQLVRTPDRGAAAVIPDS